MILKTMRFGSNKTGRIFSVDFGDIFKVHRIGLDTEPEGTSDDVHKRFTIDILVGQEPLTLYLHEVMPIPWVEIMLLRKEKAYLESYLSNDDKEGYFKPTDEYKAELINKFGNR